MNVLEELTEFEERIDRDHIERRLGDWVNRIEALYSDVRSWLPSGWTAKSGSQVKFRDDLMDKFDIPERALPVLSLEHDGVLRGRLEPRGLWIVGANGRVDLILPPRHFILIDRAENFEASQWTITPLRDRLRESPLTSENLKASFA